MLSVRFLGFDVFGTVVDWRTSIARELDAFLRQHGSDLDPEAFADAWRGLYQPSMEPIRSGQRPWVRLSVLHRETLDAVMLAPVVYFILPDKPADADWLSRVAQQRLVRNLAGEQPDDHGGSVLQALRTPRVWHLGLILFTIVLAMYGVLFYMPTLIRGAHNSSPAVIGLLTAIPYAASVIMMVLASRNSDRTGERRWHLAFACFVGAMGITLSVFTKTNIVLVIVGMCLAVGGIMMCLGIYWTLATGVFRGAQDAVAIAFVNAIGLTAGFVGPTIIGAISSWTGSTDGGMIMLAVFWLIGAALILAYRHQHAASALPPELSPAMDV
jgi:nitrate/nitrite transporter NarK